MFPKLAGMTGTGKVCEDEFREVYDLGVVVVENPINGLIIRWRPINYPSKTFYASLDY